MKKLGWMILAICCLQACQSGDKQNTTNEQDKQDEQAELIVLKNGDITLTELVSPEFNDAKIQVVTPPAGGHSPQNEVSFKFDVGDYELGVQTSDAENKGCANSAKGQHIHLILNNTPYTAHYVDEFEREVEDGRHVALAFLSRSYHESIKTQDAYQVFQFSVGEAGEMTSFNEDAPHMFYSRPKGVYEGKDAKKVMLDFYLTNVDLSADGYKVMAKINGTEFTLDKWVPYTMEGLPVGETTIELTLIDPEGNVVDSPYNPVTRTVTLS